MASKHRLLLLLDEFPSLGRLEFFETALAFIAGYGLKAFLIAQSLNQLEKAYGANNAIDYCHIRFTYAANDDRTARRISDLLGQTTKKKIQKSNSGSGLGSPAERRASSERVELNGRVRVQVSFVGLAAHDQTPLAPSGKAAPIMIRRRERIDRRRRELVRLAAC